MSSDDKVRPYHAPASSAQETADAVKAVLDHTAQKEKAQREKPAPKKQPKWMLPLGANLGVLALYLLIAPPSFIVLDPIEAPAAQEQVRGLQMAMFMQAQRIEAYRIENGELPARLEDAGSPTPGVEYRLVGSGTYQLVGVAADEALVYDSAEQSPQEWLDPSAAQRLRESAS